MARRRTYRPQIPQNTADITRADTCDTRRSMNPLTGIWPACATVPGYRYASPDGEGCPATNVHCSLYIVHWTFTFSAKERDPETGLSYFGSRYYSSDLSVWLSVDPMSGKYPSLSPYTYCADNPVKLVDPNGEDVWIPDEDGNLIAQENDDYKNLASTIGCSYGKAKKLLASQGYANGVKDGDKVILDNQYTRSINATCEHRLTDDQATAYSQQWRQIGISDEEEASRFQELACPQDLYNCWSAAMAGANGRIIGPNNYEIFTEEEFDRALENKYPVSVDRLKFGKTIIRFTKNGVCKHAAIYYGSDNEGNIYIYSKNGKYSKPFVMPLNEFLERYGFQYGEVSGFYN